MMLNCGQVTEFRGSYSAGILSSAMREWHAGRRITSKFTGRKHGRQKARWNWFSLSLWCHGAVRLKSPVPDCRRLSPPVPLILASRLNKTRSEPRGTNDEDASLLEPPNASGHPTFKHTYLG